MFARLASRLPFRLSVFAAIAAALVWPHMADAPRLNEFRDVHFLLLYQRTAIETILRYGELPLWNPYYCGGFDAVGSPQAGFVSPTLLLGLLFGAERAELLTVFFMTIVGMEGMFRWLHLRVRSEGAAMMVAPVFALSGQFAVAYYRGWTNFLGFQLVPWILFGITLAAKRKMSGVAIASIAFAWLIGFAGLFAAPMLAIAAVIEALRTVVDEPREKVGRSLVMLGIAALFMGAVAWVRLWPVAETLAASPRIMAGTPAHTARGLLNALIGELVVKDGNTELVGSFYVGSTFLALIALGGQDRRALRALAIVITFVWLAEGYGRQPSLFGWVRQIPGFASLRYPERFLWFAILFASEPAANALARVPRMGEGQGWRRIAWVVLGGSLVWTIGKEIETFEGVAKARMLGQITPLEPPVPFRQSRGNRWFAMHVQATGLGSLSCYETHRLPMSPLLRGDLPAEEYLAEGTGKVERKAWSPNAISLHVELAQPGRVLVNQNWAPGWHSSVGTTVSHEGLIGVDLPAGTHDVVLRYRPWPALAGFGVSATALLALALLLVRERRRGDLFAGKQRVPTLLAVALPCVLAGAAYAGSPDPHYPPHVPTNPNLRPAIVKPEEEASIDAARLGVQLAIPVRIEAARVSKPDENGVVTVELYLRKSGTLPRSSTMFVHFVRRKEGNPPLDKEKDKEKDDFYNADHQVVGGSFYLSDVPNGPLIRDAFGLAIKPKMARGTWDVFVAFGQVTGRAGRVKIVDPGKATIDADRVKVGELVLP
ncbi:MAG: hypothetical protein JST00_42615 [Deltaproteobacteria bacterium]|nr:hypothetical protein [Deltaproteobacteria bacterium]